MVGGPWGEDIKARDRPRETACRILVLVESFRSRLRRKALELEAQGLQAACASVKHCKMTIAS